MSLRHLISNIARINLFVGLSMIFPLAVSYYYDETCQAAILKSMIATVVPCLGLSLILRSVKEDLSAREGWFIATVSWLFAGFFGALPYLFANIFGSLTPDNFVNCYFESISGFTTTGSSVLGTAVPIESLEKGLLLWRSLTHWLGGLGILVLVVVVLPSTGYGGAVLFRSETSLFHQDKIKPRIKDVARTIWLIYFAITMIGAVLLMFGGLSFFDSFCNSIGAVATGGFSTKDASIAGFNSFYVELVAIFLMIAGSVSFSLHYFAIVSGPGAYWKRSQFRWYMLFQLVGVIVIISILYFNNVYQTLFETLRYGSFQAVSMMSTTGFTTAMFDKWPYAAQILLVVFMFMGGMVGSTSGAIKTARIVIMMKYIYREMQRIIHPKIFAAVKMGDRVIMKDEVEKVVGFFAFYVLIFMIATLLVCASGLDAVSAFSSVATTMGGVGPGLGSVGASGNFYAVPIFAKIILMCCMILGRLEIFAVVALFSSLYWKK